MFSLSHEDTAETEIMGSLIFSEPEGDGRRFKAVDEHLYSDLKGEAVVLNLVNGKYYGLNSVGVAIWKSLQTPATLAEIELSIQREFDVDRETCHREVSAFLEKMVEERLIEVLDEQAP